MASESKCFAVETLNGLKQNLEHTLYGAWMLPTLDEKAGSIKVRCKLNTVGALLIVQYMLIVRSHARAASF